jgi:hypothetical protein
MLLENPERHSILAQSEPLLVSQSSTLMLPIIPRIRAILLMIATALCLIATPILHASDDAEASRTYGLDEAAMWRAYYEGRWIDLATRTAGLVQRQFALPRTDAIRMAAHAAKAAMLFRSDTANPEVISELEKFYTIIRDAKKRKFDPKQAARLEAQWWKERREGKPPEEYSRTIAGTIALVYGVEVEKTQPAALLRAQAMAYRDERRDGLMTDADWQEIARRLAKAHETLEAALIE